METQMVRAVDLRRGLKIKHGGRWHKINTVQIADLTVAISTNKIYGTFAKEKMVEVSA